MKSESICEFYNTLNKLPKCYMWMVEDKSIVAKKTRGISKGFMFNPVTAVAHRLGIGTYANNKEATLKAGSAMGLPRSFTSNVYDAVNARSNRGNTQVVRGKILSRLDLL